MFISDAHVGVWVLQPQQVPTPHKLGTPWDGTPSYTNFKSKHSYLLIISFEKYEYNLGWYLIWYNNVLYGNKTDFYNFYYNSKEYLGWDNIVHYFLFDSTLETQRFSVGTLIAWNPLVTHLINLARVVYCNEICASPWSQSKLCTIVFFLDTLCWQK